MAKRKPISKKIRFEVFKRDKFTCQYCGRKAPDVELEIDHIKPVSKGGDNSMFNLVTSCFECNRGKKDKQLDDNSAIGVQRTEMERLQERRNQLGMMMEWQKELKTLEEEEVDYIVACIEGYTGPIDNKRFREGRKEFRKLINRYGANEVYASTKIAFDTYFNEVGDLSHIIYSLIPRVLSVREQQKHDPSIRFKNRVKAYAKKKYGRLIPDFVGVVNEYVINEDSADFFVQIMREHDEIEDAALDIEVIYAKWEVEAMERMNAEKNGDKESC